MAKYKNAYNEEDTVEESIEQPNPEVTSSEEETFKKRYGDLRRHNQKIIAEKDAQLAEMQKQLATATKKQIKFPKTEQEVAEWATKYPDVAKIIDTIAQKRVTEGLQMSTVLIEGLLNLKLNLIEKKPKKNCEGSIRL